MVLDLTKTLDVVNHILLLAELEVLTISLAICGYVASFLGHRLMRVRME